MGRPRDTGLEQRLLLTTWELVCANGYDSLSMAQVASSSGAHRSDIYRRWASKPQLVAAALTAHLPPVVEADTGSLRADLNFVAHDLVSSWGEAWIDGLVGLLADLTRDEDAALIFRRMSAERAQPLVNLIARAVSRGEISAVPDPTYVSGLLEGPIMHRRLIGRRRIDASEVALISDTAYRFLTGELAPEPPATGEAAAGTVALP